MKLLIAIFSLLFSNTQLLSQETAPFKINFEPTFLSEKLNLNQYYYANQNDSIQFTTFKFYISNIQLIINEKIVWKVHSGFYLIDLEDTNSLKIESLIPQNLEFDQISFDLGLDSLTNVSGAMGGALDPTKGMYWTWQNGYINLKLEGNCKLSAQEEKEFVFHLGGYKSPYSGIQKISFKTQKSALYQIGIELNNWISKIDFPNTKSIMSPRKEAVEMALKATKMFYLK
jgi:hypothetical protein